MAIRKKLLGLVALKKFIDSQPALKARLKRGANAAMRRKRRTPPPGPNEPMPDARR